MDDPEINLLIPIKTVCEEFICPVCYDVIKECTMTQCSHNFCKDCIMECLNRKKICPCCNAATSVKQLNPNKQFDRVIKIIVDEKEKASKEYFDALINGNNKKATNEQNPKAQTKELSPIEQVFHSHMKKSLLSYEDYYQKLEAKTVVREEHIKNHYKQLMMDVQKKTGKKALTLSQDGRIAKLNSECSEKLKENRDILQNAIELLQKSYEDYMSKCVPPPQFLPVLINISIPSKSINFPNIHINPTDTGNEIKQIIVQRMEKKGDPVIGFDKANIFLLVNETEGTKIPIMDDTVPIVGHYHPDPGSTLVLQGNLRCKSDAPKQCFKQIYIKGANQAVDYFTCNNCSSNWICPSCADACHKNHDIVPYLSAHVPTWACCYCVKKGKCTLYKKE